MAWATKRPDVTCDTPVTMSDNRYRATCLPGPLLVRILLWLLIFAAFPLSVTASVLSFRIEVLRCTTYAALPAERSMPLAERVLVRLEAAEQKESDLWLRDDIRIAWITVLEASRGNPQPHVDATYKVLGIHPDKVWPAILERRKALLGRQERLWHTNAISVGSSVTATAMTPEDYRSPTTVHTSAGTATPPTIATNGTRKPARSTRTERRKAA